MVKFFTIAILTLFFPVRSLLAQTNALPPLETIIQRALDRAATEDENDSKFNQNYGYTRVRLTEFHNAQGKLISREEKRTEEGADKVGHKRLDTPESGEKNAPLSETHSDIHGKALQVKDYSLTNLVSRFQITLVGREMVNGRPSFILDFTPRNNLPVHSYKDNFINKAAGRVWVDEADYAIAKADVHLMQQVNLLGGILGAVWKFTYAFDRARTPEGFWFARHVDWHLEGREVVFHRIVDYHEQKIDEHKISPPVH